MNKFNRIAVIVLDSVGIGEAIDAAKFGDFDVNTLGNISKKTGLKIPNLQKMGLGNINHIDTVPKSDVPSANYGKMLPIGDGKDTMTGHWEMMGVTVHQGFRQYVKKGFPEELISKFEELTGRKIICNKAGNGMEMIRENFKEHMETGAWILYTSVDSTWQLAAHEDVVPLEELYSACKLARELTRSEEYNVARVIARPFIGEFENFKRTANRHDYALDPFKKTVMEELVDNDLDVIAIGKISDIFNGKGVTKALHNQDNQDGINHTINELKEDTKGFIFTNLVDFDSLFGHPRDVEGYKNCLQEFDARLPEIINALKDDDLLIITADHGNDPTYIGNDHTRENVPLLVYSKLLKGNNEIKDCMGFECLGETICNNFDIKGTDEGVSFLEQLV
ncbi:MAG: phosphopentomutase [Mycoplasmatales bacterium]